MDGCGAAVCALIHTHMYKLRRRDQASMMMSGASSNSCKKFRLPPVFV